ncbi:hypothetical protein GYMLUDRAFT_442347 [Collybiopsis luxurians FD-317 M1]|uniref:Uncharacterized protein n=1 Tax=Collybiopsis luxurians FD-317 M1 TaxID=944289 RepID=A0A0D0CVA7_9AGAR|nr:hypothetical protein GYMLUDRAFT_442347 [Collybiopsis luxurians FD-317 M1]
MSSRSMLIDNDLEETIPPSEPDTNSYSSTAQQPADTTNAYPNSSKDCRIGGMALDEEIIPDSDPISYPDESTFALPQPLPPRVIMPSSDYESYQKRIELSMRKVPPPSPVPTELSEIALLNSPQRVDLLSSPISTPNGVDEYQLPTSTSVSRHFSHPSIAILPNTGESCPSTPIGKKVLQLSKHLSGASLPSSRSPLPSAAIQTSEKQHVSASSKPSLAAQPSSSTPLPGRSTTSAPLPGAISTGDIHYSNLSFQNKTLCQFLQPSIDSPLQSGMALSLTPFYPSSAPFATRFSAEPASAVPQFHPASELYSSVPPCPQIRSPAFLDTNDNDTMTTTMSTAVQAWSMSSNVLRLLFLLLSSR